MISPYKIKFRNKTNIDYDVLVDVSFSDDNSEVDSFLNKEVVSSTSWDGSYKRIHGYKYNQPLTATLTFVKNDFSDFDECENRKILSWLSGGNEMHKLEIYKDDTEEISYVLYGNIITLQQQKIANNRVIGYICEFENTSPYAYSPIKIIEKTVNASESILINCRTDEEEKKLYPKITITIGDSIYLDTDEDPMQSSFDMMQNTVYRYKDPKYADVNPPKYLYHININGKKYTLAGIFPADTSIENQTSDSSTKGLCYLCLNDMKIYQGCILENSGYGWEPMCKVGNGVEITNTYKKNNKISVTKSTIVGCYRNEVITLDGSNRVIASSNTPLRVFGNDFNWKFPYFIKGENNIKVSGNCTVKIEWAEPRKVGQL